jgi:hypothetical protein
MVTWTISLDPGVRNIGVSVFKDKKLIYWSTAFLENTVDPNEYTKGISNLLERIVHSANMEWKYGDTNKLVIEDQSVHCTKHFPGLAMMKFREIFPWGKIFLVDPRPVARWMDFKQLTDKKKIHRLLKKQLTQRWVQELIGFEIRSVDVCDSIMNFIYSDCRLFSKENKLKRIEIQNATYRVSTNLPITIFTDEHRPVRDQECEADPVPRNRFNPSGGYIFRDNGSIDDLNSGECGELLFSSDDGNDPELH